MQRVQPMVDPSDGQYDGPPIYSARPTARRDTILVTIALMLIGMAAAGWLAYLRRHRYDVGVKNAAHTGPNAHEVRTTHPSTGEDRDTP